MTSRPEPIKTSVSPGATLTILTEPTVGMNAQGRASRRVAEAHVGTAAPSTTVSPTTAASTAQASIVSCGVCIPSANRRRRELRVAACSKATSVIAAAASFKAARRNGSPVAPFAFGSDAGEANCTRLIR